MKRYYVCYKMYSFDEEKEICVTARNAAEAYLTAMDALDWYVWGAYVSCYEKKNGELHYFCNTYGKAY